MKLRIINKRDVLPEWKTVFRFEWLRQNQGLVLLITGTIGGPTVHAILCETLVVDNERIIVRAEVRCGSGRFNYDRDDLSSFVFTGKRQFDCKRCLKRYPNIKLERIEWQN